MAFLVNLMPLFTALFSYFQYADKQRVALQKCDSRGEAMNTP